MRKLEEGWLTVLLLCALITTSAMGVSAAGWSQGLWGAWIIGIIAVFTGLVLAKSRFNGTTATFVSLVYGLFCVGVFIAWDLSGDWHERSLELVVRMNNFLYKALTGGTSRDALPFPVFVGLIYWAVGVDSAWSVFRRASVWPAIIPAGVALLINIYYYLGPVDLDLYLAMYALLSLILLARMSLLAREKEWQVARVAYSPEMRFDFLYAGLVVALAGVMIAWAGPSLAASPAAADAWQQVTGPWSTVRESWMRLFASVRAHGQNVNDFYGDSLTLGGPSLLDDDPIMDVTVQTGIGADTPVEDRIPRYYWRAMALEKYEGDRWQAGDLEFRETDPTKTSGYRLPPYRLRREVNATFVSYVAASSKLYVPPQPRWVDRPAVFQFISTQGDFADVMSIRSSDILRRGEIYHAVASVSIADMASLRASRAPYPDWVKERFLQLPDSITPRTYALAQQIVAEAKAETPYDQAQAVTDWLRRNMTYDQNIEAPPQNVEPVDWFLFTYRKGYCNYYASAEVVLLRSLGIPARMAVGFAEGLQDPETGAYHVLERDAHAWPEVFFPEYGWVEFEPTVAQLPIIRPEARAAVTPPSGFQSPDREELGDADQRERDQAEQRDQSPKEEDEAAPAVSNLALFYVQLYGVRVLVGVLLVLAVILAGLSVFLRSGLLGWESFGGLGAWVIRRQGLPVPSIVSRVYLQLERAAHWLGLSLSSTLTPHERVAALGEALPNARPGMETITEQYVTEQYSPYPADATASESAWRGIRLSIWKAGLDTLRRSLVGGGLGKKREGQAGGKTGG